MAGRRGPGGRPGGAVERKRVVMWSHLPPAGGGLTVVARNLAADPDLNDRYDMEFRGTHEAPPHLVERFHLHNVVRLFKDAWSLNRQVRGAAVVELFSAGHSSILILRMLVLTVSARLAGARVLVYLGSGKLYPDDPSEFVPRRGLAPLYRLLGMLVGAFVIIDDNARPVLQPLVGRARIELIPAPIDPDLFAADERPERDRPVLLHAGRITREKGVPDLLEACGLLDRRGIRDWELRLVGPLERSTNDELAEIERRAEELGRVTFVGWVDGIAGELAGADVFVSASHREGLSGAIAEACMSGLPVVATRVGATATVVRDGRDGFLVPRSDPAALADGMAKLLTDAGLRREMGAGARAHAIDLYGREHVAARYVELIEELTA